MLITEIKPQTVAESIDNDFVFLPKGYKNWPLANKNKQIEVVVISSEEKLTKVKADYKEGYDLYLMSTSAMDFIPF